MRILDPKLPLDNPRMAKMAAETIVCCGFNAARAARELRPDLKAHRNFAHRLMREPAVKKEIEKIMERSDRNPKKYQEEIWEWFLAPMPADPKEWKNWNERKCTAARLLGKAYIDTKGRVAETAQKPMVIEGLEEGLANLTGDESKVM